jgi:hypothetical protein
VLDHDKCFYYDIELKTISTASKARTCVKNSIKKKFCDIRIKKCNKTTAKYLTRKISEWYKKILFV